MTGRTEHKQSLLTHRELLSTLEYDPETGHFTWRHRPDMRPQWNSRFAGRLAGGVGWGRTGGRYWRISVNDQSFKAHRLAWFYMTGDWPPHEIDHIDLDSLNNRWKNLRSATRSENAANRKAYKNNTSGFKGVSLHPASGLYASQIMVRGKNHFLGYFKDPEAASEAYAAASIRLCGEFGRRE